MRKNLLANSLKAVRDGKAAATEDEQKPRKLSGVLDVQRGLDQLSAGAARQIDPAQISESAVKDRFDVQDGLEDLTSSIRASGQKLPVLLRRTPQGALPYEVVYGRRRIEACRQLGIQVLAHIAELSDREALISQGLENAARLQRSFIEQSVYAEQLLRHEFSREDIMEVLAVDKTTISRMLGVVSDVPRAIIERIGPAHDSGRRPWQHLRELLKERTDLDESAVAALIPAGAADSNERLHGLIRALTHSLPGMGAITLQPAFRPILRREIMAAVNTCSRDLGIRQGAVVVLDALLSCLPCHGADGREAPVTPTTLLTVYASNETLCFRAKGLTDRQLRRHLETLEASGLIRRRDSANGKRFPVMQHGKPWWGAMRLSGQPEIWIAQYEQHACISAGIQEQDVNTSASRGR